MNRIDAATEQWRQRQKRYEITLTAFTEKSAEQVFRALSDACDTQDKVGFGECVVTLDEDFNRP